MALQEAQQAAQATRPIIHHAANAGPLAVPVVSLAFNWGEAVTIVTGILAGIYYCIIIAKSIRDWNRKDD